MSDTSFATRIIGDEGLRRRILVADDHAANRSLLEDLLTPLGFEVTTANDGAQALAEAGAQPFDLILLDMRMPVVDGLAAARRILEEFRSRGAQPPVIIGISASAFLDDRQSFLDAGCVGFLAKPLREQQVLGLLSHHLGLTWTHSGGATEDTQFLTRAREPEGGIVPPDAGDLAELARLAQNGDVLGVRQVAERLPVKDPRLLPFSRAIINLASRHKMKSIRQFLARFTGTHASSGPP